MALPLLTVFSFPLAAEAFGLAFAIVFLLVALGFWTVLDEAALFFPDVAASFAIKPPKSVSCVFQESSTGGIIPL